MLKQSSQKQFQMFTRVRQFGLANPAEFPPETLAGRLFSDLADVMENLSNAAAAQEEGERRSAVDAKDAARRALREDLDAIARSASSVAVEIPELRNRFRLNGARTDQELLAKARAFAESVEPWRTKFIEHELPANFVEDLRSDIGAFEQARDRLVQTTARAVTATRSIEDAAREGLAIVKRLDTIVRNRFKRLPAKLDGWKRARTVERPVKQQSSGKPKAGEKIAA